MNTSVLTAALPSINVQLAEYAELFSLIAALIYTLAFILFTVDAVRSSATIRRVEQELAAESGAQHTPVPADVATGSAPGPGGAAGAGPSSGDSHTEPADGNKPVGGDTPRDGDTPADEDTLVDEDMAY